MVSGWEGMLQSTGYAHLPFEFASSNSTSCVIMLTAGWVKLLVAIVFYEKLNGTLANLEMVVFLISQKGLGDL